MEYERYCCLFASLFPKLLCSFIYLWSCYTLCFSIFFNHIGGFTGSTLAVLNLCLVGIALYTYFSIISTGPGSPLDFASLHIDNSNGGGPWGPPPPTLITTTIKNNGQYRYCDKCCVWKPDRSHHCSSCHICVLRMDHHCPWFACCIGYRNHKFFIQFLVYSTVFAVSCLGTTAILFYKFIVSDSYLDEYFSINYVVLFAVSLAVSISIGLFTGFSIYLVLKNKTTIEFQETNRYKSSYQFTTTTTAATAASANIFDLGSARNWELVMGNSWWQWVFPIAVADSGEGLNYEINQGVYDELERGAALQSRLQQQLGEYSRNRSLEGFELV